MTRQAKYSRALLYLVIIVGAIPLMSPFFWLVSSSLKTYNRVYHYPPEWLPVTEDFFVIEKNAPSLMVNLIDKNEDTQTGVYRIRIIGQGENDFLVLPDSMIKVHTRKITLATVDNQQHEIEIIARSPAEKAVRAKVKNKFSQITLPTERVMSRTKTKSAIRLYRQNVIVEVVEKNESKAKVRIAGVSEPFDIALSRLNVNSTDSALAEITGKNLLAQVIRRNELAGIASVRLMPSATLLEVESPSIFETRFTEYFIDLDNRQIPVKWVTRGSKGEMSVVMRLDKPLTIEFPEAQISEKTITTYHTSLYGQSIEIQPESREISLGMTAVKILEPLRLDQALVEGEKKFAPQWRNYIDVLKKEPFHYYVLNTLFIALCAILGQVLSCSVVGYAFARLRFPGRDLLFIVLLSTMMLPHQIILIPQFIIYVKLGWLDSFKPLIVPTFLAQSAFFVFLFRQYFMTISYDLEDAARIDGCGPLYSYWHIMLPLAKPVIVTVAVYTFMWTWNDFLYPLLYLNSDEYQTLALALQNFKTAFGLRDPHLLMAASTMMVVPSILLFFLAQRAFIRGVVVTGVKG